MDRQTTESKYDNEPEEFFVAEFGSISLDWLDPGEKYAGAVFKLSPEVCRQIAELLGFTAKFDNSGVRTAVADILDLRSSCVFEIERNAKPTDIALRYSRDRWTASNSSSDNSRPWIKTSYEARYISEDLIASIGEQLKIKAERAKDFIIRVNFKDNTAGLICSDADKELMPASGFATFNLPTAAMFEEKNKLDESPPVEPSASKSVQAPALEARDEAVEKKGEPPAEQAPKESSIKSKKHEQRRDEMESSAKYATYSRSEIDQMLKQQAETVANALGSKISSQQRVFQDAVEKQEKTFAKISDDFAMKFDTTRTRLETQSKESEDSIRAELDTFKKDLSKELENFRSHIVKTVLPVAKFIDEKNAVPLQKKDKKKDEAKDSSKADADAAKPTTGAGAADPGLRPILYIILALTFFSVAALFGVVIPQLGRIDELKNEVSSLRYKISEMEKSGGSKSSGSVNSGNAGSTAPAQ